MKSNNSLEGKDCCFLLTDNFLLSINILDNHKRYIEGNCMKKHILILCLLGNPYNIVEGGFHKTIYEIIEYFKEKDIIITVITSNIILSKDKFQQLYDNINFWELALNPEWVLNQDQLYLNVNYLVNKVKQVISNYENTISMIHSLQWINGYLATQINMNRKMMHIHSIISSSYERKISGFSVRSQYQRQCEDITFKAADLLISITEAEKNQLTNYYKIPPSKILIIGRTADLYYSYFHNIYNSRISKIDKLEYNSGLIQCNNPRNQKVYVYVGRIIEYKGIREIIKAWHIIYEKYRDKTPPLWIIGGTEKDIYQFRNNLLKDILFLDECEKKHKIYWWGYMENYGISTIFQKSHVLIMHSAFEPGGRVLLEAMSASKPVIATPMGFAQTYIKNWINGFLIQYQDISHLSVYMEFFVKNEYLSSMMGINAKTIYELLNNKWQYYKRLDELYYTDKVENIDISSPQFILESIHPFLIDEFPYCDIKNEDMDLLYLLNKKNCKIVEITNFKSYIWKITYESEMYIAKQVYNRINLSQLWNPEDLQKVHTIWMQYNTTILSTKYKCIITPLIFSNKLFTYLVPYYEILSEDKTYNIYPNLLRQLKRYEYGIYKNNSIFDEEVKYFKKINKTIQLKHKYYTMRIYEFELHKVFNENKSLFQHDEDRILNQCFKKINQYISKKNQIEYGLNYGKNFLEHIIQQNKSYLLLPSSDIFVGELGQDEGILFAEYFLKYRKFLNSYFYSRKEVLIWCLLYCMELFIRCKILKTISKIKLEDFKYISNNINTET